MLYSELRNLTNGQCTPEEYDAINGVYMTLPEMSKAAAAARAAAKRIARYVYSASVIIDYYDDNLKLLSREQSSNPSVRRSWHTVSA